jgi:hypothetical protein
MHCETPPLGSGDINRVEPWLIGNKPEDQAFQVKPRNGVSRALQVGDTVAVVGRWVIDHHPEFCNLPTEFDPPEATRCRARGLLRVGPDHVELHPFRWDDIKLVEPLAPGDAATAVVSLAAPLHEEQYLGGGKWVANEVAGVAGKVFLGDGPEGSESNFHTIVEATVELDPPPRPEPFDPLMRTVWTEEVLALGDGMALGQVRAVRLRPDGGITVRVVLDSRHRDGSPPSIEDPAQGRSIFQARYSLRWERVMGNDATYVGQAAPRQMEAGQTQSVSVRMRNSGTSRWSPGAVHRLGSQSPQDNTVWGLARAPVTVDTLPGATHDFDFSIKAPATPGRYSFQWRMLEEMVEWFGDLTPRVVIEVVPAGGRTTVPDVRELSRTAAGKLVRAAGLVPAFTGDATQNAYVATQTPDAETEVDAGTTVQMHCLRGPVP